MSWEPVTPNPPFQPPRSTTSIGDLLFELKHAQKIGGRRPTTQGSLLNKRINDFQKIFYTQDGIHGRDLFDLQADEHRSGLMEMAHSFLLQQGSIFWPADARHHNYKPDLVLDRDREDPPSHRYFTRKNLPRSKNIPYRESDIQPTQPLVFKAEPSQDFEVIDTSHLSTQPEAASETNTATHIEVYGHELNNPRSKCDSYPNVDVNHGSTATCRPSVAPGAEASCSRSWTIRWAGNFAMSLSITRDSNPLQY
ncbi:unnamed protein product [Clonostachys solani]|uniref:Uncharacterized protein n=1 Tax=Clonostachys solani TaxID=160281 RepID=A0A9P0EG50_9HYPO|nr:unnamed protein product [Clonostachys solani]